MTDSKQEIQRKMEKAWCPEKQVQENPVMEYFRYIIFEKFDKVEMKRPEKFGGDLTINSYAELEKTYSGGKIHPLDLKKTCAVYIDEIVKPVREHFEKNKEAKKLKELVESFKVTR